MNSRKQTSTQGIILTRIDYGEADRILTVLTPDHGKLRLMARGVRRIKSKLAGGIELFSVSDITFVPGRGDIGTLASSRLNIHYGNIPTSLDRTMLGYELIKLLHKNTEDSTDPEYFELLKDTFVALNMSSIGLDVVRLWFGMQLLGQAGHAPNLQTDTSDRPLDADQNHSFDLDNMSFTPAPSGKFGSSEIKMLRLAQGRSAIQVLAKVQGGADLAMRLNPLLDTMLHTHLRV